MKRHYRFTLFNLGFWTWLFNPQKFIQVIQSGTAGGFRLLRRELTWEPRRFMFILNRPAFGIVFQRDDGQPEPEHEWKIVMYKTRFFTRTIDIKKMDSMINGAAQEGYEMFFSMKYPCRFLLMFPREAYFFIFRRRTDGSTPLYRYHIQQTPYRFFTKTIDPEVYAKDLNQWGNNRQLKITWRDERRLFGIFTQPTAVAIWEDLVGSKRVDGIPSAVPVGEPIAASPFSAGSEHSPNRYESNPAGIAPSSSGQEAPVPPASAGLQSGIPSATPLPSAQPIPKAVPANEEKVQIQCTCGKKLVGDASLRGKQIRCPNCGSILAIS